MDVECILHAAVGVVQLILNRKFANYFSREAKDSYIYEKELYGKLRSIIRTIDLLSKRHIYDLTVLPYLPDEIYPEIFKFLTNKDRKNVRLVCKKWREICNNSMLLCRQEVLIYNRIISRKNFVSAVQRTDRKFLHLKFIKIKLRKYDERFLKNLGHKIHWLNFEDCTFRKGVLINIRNGCQNLSNLTVTSYKRNGSLKYSPELFVILEACRCRTLKELTIFAAKLHVGKFMKRLPQLKYLQFLNVTTIKNWLPEKFFLIALTALPYLRHMKLCAPKLQITRKTFEGIVQSRLLTLEMTATNDEFNSSHDFQIGKHFLLPNMTLRTLVLKNVGTSLPLFLEYFRNLRHFRSNKITRQVLINICKYQMNLISLSMYEVNIEDLLHISNKAEASVDDEEIIIFQELYRLKYLDIVLMPSAWNRLSIRRLNLKVACPKLEHLSTLILL